MRVSVVCLRRVEGECSVWRCVRWYQTRYGLHSRSCLLQRRVQLIMIFIDDNDIHD